MKRRTSFHFNGTVKMRQAGRHKYFAPFVHFWSGKTSTLWNWQWLLDVTCSHEREMRIANACASNITFGQRNRNFTKNAKQNKNRHHPVLCVLYVKIPSMYVCPNAPRACWTCTRSIALSASCIAVGPTFFPKLHQPIEGYQMKTSDKFIWVNESFLTNKLTNHTYTSSKKIRLFIETYK